MAGIGLLSHWSVRLYADSHAGAVHGNSAVAHAAQPAATPKPHSTPTPHSTTPHSTGNPHATPPPATTPPTTTPPTAPLNPVAAKIAGKPQLSARITAMLPAGMTLNQASAGFRNQGQFIATLHAGQRLNCPTCVAQLKNDMVVKGFSLGQAIQDVRHLSPSSATTIANHSEHDAEVDVEISNR